MSMTLDLQATLLNVVHLSKSFAVGSTLLGRPRALLRATNDISFHVGHGEIFGLVGESGSGKSTVGKLVLRLIDSSAGKIEFNGIDITSLSNRKMRPLRPKMQMVFQDPFSSLNPRKSVFDILEMPLKVQKTFPDATRRRQRVNETLELVGLSAKQAARYPHEFSGGQRQRISIARALVTSTEFIVADEPVSALDVSIQAQIVQLFLDVRRKLGLGMLFISHDLAVVGYMCDRIAVMYLGRIVELGRTIDIFRSPAHPYTESLLSAVPSVDKSYRRKRILLHGDVPSPLNMPTGCAFRTRCRYALSACGDLIPPLVEVGAGHFKACIRDDISLQTWGGNPIDIPDVDRGRM